MKRKRHLTTILLVLILLTGLGLILYPTFSDYWNSYHQVRAINSYVEAVGELDQEDYKSIWEAAKTYNQKLAQSPSHLMCLTEEEAEEYENLLDISGTGIMGYVDIPKIRLSLPIYHGTDEKVLQVAIGHLDGSSLPVGGESTHCVISGHRGLPSAKLFSNLDQMEEGDYFILSVLNEKLTYQVDQILTVLPEETEALMIEPGMDYCTLVTCTPYGINTHRLLVRGHRVPNLPDTDTMQDTGRIPGWGVVLVPGGVVPAVLLCVVAVNRHRKKRKETARRKKQTEKN